MKDGELDITDKKISGKLDMLFAALEKISGLKEKMNNREVIGWC
jgi:hypothetical protein